MREVWNESGREGWLRRAARMAYAFVALNSAAVVALLSVVLRRRVWR